MKEKDVLMKSLQELTDDSVYRDSETGLVLYTKAENVKRMYGTNLIRDLIDSMKLIEIIPAEKNQCLDVSDEHIEVNIKINSEISFMAYDSTKNAIYEAYTPKYVMLLGEQNQCLIL